MVIAHSSFSFIPHEADSPLQGYWDWSLGKLIIPKVGERFPDNTQTVPDADDITGSSIFDSNPVTGLGSFGPQSNGFHLTDGAFSDFILAYPKPHTLSRNFSDTPFALGRLQPTPWIVSPSLLGRVSQLITGMIGR